MVEIIVVEIMTEIATDLGILLDTLLTVVVVNVIGNEKETVHLDILIETMEGIGLDLHNIHHTDVDIQSYAKQVDSSLYESDRDHFCQIDQQ